MGWEYSSTIGRDRGPAAQDYFPLREFLGLMCVNKPI